MGERIDLLRSTIDDLEIEFEVMQRALNRFDSRHAIDRRARIEAAYEAFEDDLMDRDGAVSVPLSDLQRGASRTGPLDVQTTDTTTPGTRTSTPTAEDAATGTIIIR